MGSFGGCKPKPFQNFTSYLKNRIWRRISLYVIRTIRKS